MATVRIFVSHSHHDTVWCEDLVNALLQRGYDPWLDKQRLQVGDQWKRKIEQELQAREVFVVVLTPDAWASDWVQSEISLAMTLKRRIIPVLFQQTRIEGFLLNYQWIRAIDTPIHEVVQQIADAIEGKLIIPPAEALQKRKITKTQSTLPQQGNVIVNQRHRAIAAYYTTLTDLRGQGVVNEGGLRRAFETLLSDIGREAGWTLIAEAQSSKGNYPDATLRDANTLPRGYWEAKDTQDDLDTEIERKLAKGYPSDNIIFEDTQRAVLIQNGKVVLDVSLNNPPILPTF
jgi:hypothetical protein